MEIKTTISAVVAAIVCVVIVVTVAIPIISDVSSDIRAVDHNNVTRFLMVDDGGDVDLVIEKVESGVYTLNGELIEDTPNYWCIVTDKTFFRCDSIYKTMLIEGSNKTPANGATLAFNDGIWTYTNGDTVLTGKYNWLLYPDPNGDYAYFYNTDVWVDRDATVYSYREYQTSTEGEQCPIIYTSGSINDGFTTNAYYSNTAVDATVEFISTETSDYANLGNLQVTYGSNTPTELGPIIAPWVYHVDNGISDGMKSIVNIIPLLMIVGIITAVVAAFIRRS